MPDGNRTTLSQLADTITPWALRVAATLRLADRLAQGPATAGQLAEWAGVDADALGRVLRYLSVRGVFAESGDGSYELTELSRPLQDGHPSGMRMFLDADGMGGRMDRAFGELLYTVRTGRPAYDYVHGAPFWEHIAAHPETTPSFDDLMALHDFWFDELVTAYDWAAAGSVTDVGGGSGRLLARILGHHREVSATLLDVAQTVKGAEQHLGDAGVLDRCRLVAGSFFEPLPTGSRVYLVANILHDWADADVVRILSRCAQAAEPDARVLVADRLVAAGGDERLITMLDLRMLTTVGGRERDLAQYSALAAESGLAPVSTTNLSGGFALMEFRPQDRSGA